MTEHSNHRVQQSSIACIANRLPPLDRTTALLKVANQINFRYPTSGKAIDKVIEELGEVEDAIRSGDRRHTQEELGDLIQSSIALAVHEGVDPRAALAATNKKWTGRFTHMEERLRTQGKTFCNTPRNEYMKYWEEAKRNEKEMVGSGSPSR